MARTVSRYVSKIFWENDMASINRVKKETQMYARQINNILKKEIKNPMANWTVPKTPSTGGKVGASGIQDAHVREAKNYLNELKAQDVAAKQLSKSEERFQKEKEARIRRMLIALRGVDSEEKNILATMIRQTRTKDELAAKELEIRRRIDAVNNQERQRLRVMKQQNVVQQRMNTSIMQMVGGLGSAYAMYEGLRKTIAIGIDYEGLNRAFQVVEADGVRSDADVLARAGEQMDYVKSQAKELGIPLREAARGYMALNAAMSNKLEVGQIKEIFEGVNQAAVALGLSQDAIQKVTLAVKQMGSKPTIMAEELKNQMGRMFAHLKLL
jgi:hypothetical protein